MLRHVMLILLFLLGGAGPAAAGGAAFLGLTDLDRPSWGRDLAAQETLRAGLGFDDVDLNANTTPGELAARAAAFLGRPGTPGTRRLVWISGPESGPDNPCPGPDAPLFRPAVPAFILAPACFGEVLDLPVGTFHLSMREMDPDAPLQRTGEDTPGVGTVFIALPTDNAAIIEAANRIVLEALISARQGDLSPVALLQRLRLELRLDGSDYVPTLDAFPRSHAWSRRYLAPAGAAPRPFLQPAADSTVRRVWRRPNKHSIVLFPRPDASPVAAYAVAGNMPIDFIRRSRDGDMSYVRTAEGLFGWIRSDAIAP